MKNKVIVFVLVLTLLLTACNSENTVGGITGETSEQAVKNMLEGVKTLDKEKISKYLDYDELIDNKVEEDEQELADEQIKKMLNKLEYNIISVDENGETSVVKAEITNIDMERVIKEMFGNMLTLAMGEAFKDDSLKLTDEEMEQKTYEYFDNAIEKHKDEKVTNSVDIKLNKINGQWKIDIDENMKNAITGNLSKATEDINNSFKSQSEPIDEETNTGVEEREESQNVIEIALNEKITIDDVCEFTIKGFKFTEKIIPSNVEENGGYLYYEVQDSGNLFIDIMIEYKNLESTEIIPEEFCSAKIKYDNKYEYTTFLVVEDNDGKDISGGYTSIAPLTTKIIHVLPEVPAEVQNSGKSISANITINENVYTVSIR